MISTSVYELFQTVPEEPKTFKIQFSRRKKMQKHILNKRFSPFSLCSILTISHLRNTKYILVGWWGNPTGETNALLDLRHIDFCPIPIPLCIARISNTISFIEILYGVLKKNILYSNCVQTRKISNRDI